MKTFFWQNPPPSPDRQSQRALRTETLSMKDTPRHVVVNEVDATPLVESRARVGGRPLEGFSPGVAGVRKALPEGRADCASLIKVLDSRRPFAVYSASGKNFFASRDEN